MKKLLVLALVVFGAVASQAVTYTWNSEKNNFVDTSTGSLMYAYTDITSLKITVTYQNKLDTSTNKSAYCHDYFAIKGNESDGVNGLLKMAIKRYSTYVSGVAQVTASSPDGTTTVTEPSPHFNENRCAQNLDITTVFTFGGLNSDGVFTTLNQVHHYDYAQQEPTRETNLTGKFDFNEKVLNMIEVYDNSEVVSATIEIEGTPWVPEPGVVTLLALGVAGLALRRKVA